MLEDRKLIQLLSEGDVLLPFPERENADSEHTLALARGGGCGSAAGGQERACKYVSTLSKTKTRRSDTNNGLGQGLTGLPLAPKPARHSLGDSSRNEGSHFHPLPPLHAYSERK